MHPRPEEFRWTVHREVVAVGYTKGGYIDDRRSVGVAPLPLLYGENSKLPECPITYPESTKFLGLYSQGRVAFDNCNARP